MDSKLHSPSPKWESAVSTNIISPPSFAFGLIRYPPGVDRCVGSESGCAAAGSGLVVGLRTWTWFDGLLDALHPNYISEKINGVSFSAAQNTLPNAIYDWTRYVGLVFGRLVRRRLPWVWETFALGRHTSQQVPPTNSIWAPFWALAVVMPSLEYRCR